MAGLHILASKTVRQTVKHHDVNKVEADSLSRTSLSLLHRAMARDEDAWVELVDLYGRRIYRWCRQAGLQPADAGNVVQEVFQAAARNLSGIRKETHGTSFRGWLRRITQNKIRDHYRAQARRHDVAQGGSDAQRWLLNSEAPDGDERSAGDHDVATCGTMFAAVKRDVVERVRAEFSERDWRFFWRVVVDGQSAVEVGQEYGVSANTVRLVKMRILRRMRAIWNSVRTSDP
jgi:RNA polymerase sigma-70 factor (ECF subfamily)